ncbi:MAG: hypothetical protein KBE23_07665 [Chloroflexi bacterium]|nr:hypothetical protein [Chloroflexota bacterium]MBP7042607.1 hypothetical protein [Chloroflexota bacterium]
MNGYGNGRPRGDEGCTAVSSHHQQLTVNGERGTAVLPTGWCGQAGCGGRTR